MNDWQKMVQEFHEKFELPCNKYAPFRNWNLRCGLIAEELHELYEAIDDCDIAESVDALVDILYVTIGTAVEWGIDLDPIFKEVHRTNMLKEGGKVREDGKILKPEGWEKPRIAELLEEQKNESRS